jgi:hypothetical protein
VATKTMTILCRREEIIGIAQKSIAERTEIKEQHQIQKWKSDVNIFIAKCMDGFFSSHCLVSADDIHFHLILERRLTSVVSSEFSFDKSSVAFDNLELTPVSALCSVV